MMAAPTRSIAFALVVVGVLAAQQAPATEEFVRVEGRVVDMRGEPVPAADVWVDTQEAPDTAIARTICDGDGYYLIAKARVRGSLQVRATAPGRVIGKTVLARDAVFTEVLLHDAACVTGVLRDRSGKPVAGAVVRAALDRTRSMFNIDARATTDAEGRFAIDTVPLGIVAVVAIVPGEGLAEAMQPVVADTSIVLTPSREPRIDLDIEVRGLTAEAAQRVRLLVATSPGSRRLTLPPAWESPRLSGDGRCTLYHVPDHDYVVRSMLDGFVFDPRECRVVSGKGNHWLTFTAEPAGSAKLRWAAELHDGASNPLGNVSLVMQAPDGGQHATAITAVDGTLQFDSPLAVGTRAVVYATGGPWVLDQKRSGDEVALDARNLARHGCDVNPTARLSLVAIPACRVSGRILLPDGRPAPLVHVGLEDEVPIRFPPWLQFDSATTDRNGNYSFQGLHHIDRPIRVRVAGPAGSAASADLAIDKPGTVVAAQDLQLTPPASIEGVVRDVAGNPVPGARVWLHEWDFITIKHSANVVEVITDKLGRYRFSGATPGGASLQFMLDDESPRGRTVDPFEVEAGKALTFDLVLPGK
jgi:protocatechuate 3,4-dioxygenase beta subunit